MTQLSKRYHREWARIIGRLVLILSTFFTVSVAAESERLHIAVVLDASMSMKEQDPGELAQVAARLLVDLATAADELHLITFGTTSTILGKERMTDDAARLRLQGALQGAIRDQWCTDYRVGLQTALNSLGSAKKGERRLVIFLTDGLFDPDRSNLSYYTSDTGKALLGQKQAEPEFALKPCARAYADLIPHVSGGFLTQMGQLTQAFTASGVRLYTVGLGSDLASGKKEAIRSRQLLEQIAGATGGAFLSATHGSELPGFFANIYSALVGAPVAAPIVAPKAAQTLNIDVYSGASRVAIIADAEGAPTLRLDLIGPDGRPAPHQQRGFNTSVKGQNGYRMLILNKPAPGRYQLRRTTGEIPLKVQVVQEVGLQLMLTGFPDVLPEGSTPKISVGLRTAAKAAVPLSPEYISQLKATVTYQAPNAPKAPPTEVSLDTKCSAGLSLPALTPGRHQISAVVTHKQGLLQVPGVTATCTAIHQFAIDFAKTPIAFDVMADETPLSTDRFLELAAGSRLPVPQQFSADWSMVSGIEHLQIAPTEFTLGPKTRRVPISISLKDPVSLRQGNIPFKGIVTIVPKQPELYKGVSKWAPISVTGQIRPWTWQRYYQQYRTLILSILAGMLVLLWLLGRAVAGKWSKRVRLHYIDLEDPTQTETTINLHRKSKSHLPFRSARHHCGRGGTPGKRGKKRYCTLVAGRGRIFYVVPRDVRVTYERDGDPRSVKKRFRGRFEERYRLGERYEVWLSCS